MPEYRDGSSFDRMSRPTILLFFALMVGASSAQQPVLIYATHDDYVNGKADTAGTYVDLVPVVGQYTLIFNTEGEKRRIPCRSIWGFVLNDVLFRIESDAHLPVRLMTKGAICYYENGPAHLIMQRDGTELGSFILGHQSYLSGDLAGDIVPAIFKEEGRSPSEAFRAGHPQYEPLFNCLGDRDELDHTRQCVVDFEASLEKE